MTLYLASAFWIIQYDNLWLLSTVVPSTKGITVFPEPATGPKGVRVLGLSQGWDCLIFLGLSFESGFYSPLLCQKTMWIRISLTFFSVLVSLPPTPTKPTPTPSPLLLLLSSILSLLSWVSKDLLPLFFEIMSIFFLIPCLFFTESHRE